MPGSEDEDHTESLSRQTNKKIAEYKVYWNKSHSKRVLVLQFPNWKKEEALNNSVGKKPLEIRLKPKTGLVEVDVPIHIDGSYDKSRAVQFGHALKQSKSLQHKGEYGLAGGFGTQTHYRARGGSIQSSHLEQSEAALLSRFDEALQEDWALNKITLGGRIKAFANGDPIYAVGAFHRDELHLTKVDAICSLQPQFHHLDAMTDNERLVRSAPVDQADSEARAVNMTVKSTEEEEIDMGDVGKVLRAMQEEQWQHMEWIDEEADKSYITYENELIVPLSLKNSRLISTMTEEQYLEATSAPRMDPALRGEKILRNHSHLAKDTGSEGSISSSDEEDMRPAGEHNRMDTGD